MLDHDGAGAPVLLWRAPAPDERSGRHVQARRDLLGLGKIGMRGLCQRRVGQWHDALIALHVRTLVNRHGEVTATEEGAFAAPKYGTYLLRIEMRIGPDLAGAMIVGYKHVKRAIRLGLQDELAVEFERAAEHC